MMCNRCRVLGAVPHGSSVPWYCDACGFPIAEKTGEAIRTTSAEMAMGQLRILEAHNCYEPDPWVVLREIDSLAKESP